MITAVTTMRAMHDELRDLHAARFAEISALREMLVHCRDDAHSAHIAGRMRESVAEILRLQKIIALIEE
jgi:ferritin-like metal-binding protein YciE